MRPSGMVKKYVFGILLIVTAGVWSGCIPAASRGTAPPSRPAGQGQTGWGDESPPKPQSVAGKSATSRPVGWVEYGKADYYASSLQGRTTTSGEVYDPNDFTAAHATLPFGTICRVTNLANEKSVEVRINDRAPFREGRILHLSYRAAQALNAIAAGVIEVKLEVVRPRSK